MKCPVCGRYQVYLKFEAKWVCPIAEHNEEPDEPAEKEEPE